MHKKHILLICIIVLAAVFRLWKLDRIPSGFIPEEVSTGWNAYSLLKTGRDEWGTFMPIVFRETGGYKLALNSYLIVPFMAVFGPNEFAVRLPVALSGVLAVFLTYLVGYELFRKKSWALSAAFLLAVSPWHIAMGRYAVDVNLGIPLFLAGLYFFLKAQNRPQLLLVSGLFFALTYYTYFNYVVFTLLFLVSLAWIYRKRLISFDMRTYVVLFGITQVVALLPYVLTPTLFIRLGQATSVSKIGFTNRINEARGACEGIYPPIICRGIYNKYSERAYEYSRNVVNHYSTTTYFLYGSQLGLSGMPDRWGFLHVFEFPLILTGIVLLIQKRKTLPIIVVWFFLYGLPGSLASEAHIWRMMTFLPLPQIIGGIGLATILTSPRLRLIALGMTCVIALMVTRYWVDYTAYFPRTQSANSYYGFRDTYTYLKTIEKNYDTIVVAPSSMGFDQLYIYYLFYNLPDPRRIQLSTDSERNVGDQNWVNVSRIGKWLFTGDVRNIISTLPDDFLVVSDGSYPENQILVSSEGMKLMPLLINTIYLPSGDPAFKIVAYSPAR